MRVTLYLLILTCIQLSCQTKVPSRAKVYTADVDNFWQAYDQITLTTDTTSHAAILQELYLDKGTAGLKAIIEVRNYTTGDYLKAINSYPEFWNSIRANTLKSKTLEKELEAGIKMLQKNYPAMKPASIYFTVGALRTSGTTKDSVVLIGSELAMADTNTVTSEFPAQMQGLTGYFNTNPIDDLVLLNVHELVHTQQKPMVHNLLSQSLYEGVAEFVSTTAMNVPSATPAIAYGKANEEKVRQKFEKDMFMGYKTNEWLWSNADNGFGVRDLGYYVGYEIAERYYKKSKDKSAAIKNLIELDYSNEAEVEDMVDGTGFFSGSLHDLLRAFETSRPKVVGIHPFENDSQDVSPDIRHITVAFSQELNQKYRNFDYGPLGESAAIRIKQVIGFSEDGKSVTFEIQDLEPDKEYQLLVGSGFRSIEGIPLQPYLVSFKTGRK